MKSNYSFYRGIISGLIILLVSIHTSMAQSKKTAKALSNARLLQNTVFGTKDSATMEKLFGKTVVYQHSSGKIEAREEALRNIIRNKSIYKPAADAAPISFSAKEDGDSVIVTHVFRATEVRPDGRESPLNLSIDTVWLKEGKKWKLYRRRASKIL